jgi:hypothetical protein
MSLVWDFSFLWLLPVDVLVSFFLVLSPKIRELSPMQLDGADDSGVEAEGWGLVYK